MEKFNSTLIKIIIIGGLITGILLVVWGIGSMQPKSSTTIEIPTLAQVDVEININQAAMVGIDSSILVFDPGEVYLYIPPNAISSFGQISFIPKEENLLAEAGEPGWERPLVYNIEFKDALGKPTDVNINGFIEVCFMVDDSLWEVLQEGSEKFQIQYYDESQSPIRWVALKMNVYSARQQVCGETTHFSLFALAYQLPATPTPSPSSTNENTETATESPTETETPDGVYEP